MPPQKAAGVGTKRGVKAQDPDSTERRAPGRPRKQPQAAAPSNDLVEELPNTKDGLSNNADTPSQNLPEPTNMPPPSETQAAASRPVQRLDSLSRRSSGTPSATRLSGVANTKPGLKFKPKSIIRRSQEEREAAERLEAERRQARFAAAGTFIFGGRGRGDGRGGFRGRGRGAFTRGRGSARGGFAEQRLTVASGPFASAAAMTHWTAGSKKSSVGAGAKATSSGTSKKAIPRVKREPGMSRDKERDTLMTDGPAVKSEYEDPMYISSDEDEITTEGPRMDIEQINLVSDEEDEEDPIMSKGKGRAKASGALMGGLKPIRIDRREHVERSMGVNTEASSTVSSDLRSKGKLENNVGGLFIPSDEPEIPRRKGKERRKDVEFVKNERKWQGVYQDEDEDEKVKIKDEPIDTGNAIAEDIPNGPHDISTETPTADDNAAFQPVSVSSPKLSNVVLKAKPKKRRKSGLRDTKRTLQTEEDRQEWARREHDIRLLGEELGMMQTAPDPETATAGAEGEGGAAAESTASQAFDRKEGRLFLFQFPPIAPALFDPLLKGESTEEPQQTIDVDEPPAPNPSKKTPASGSKASKANPAVKTEQKLAPKPDPLTAIHPALPLGQAGKLTIRESGRVLLSWGGASLELGRGTDCEFLQDVMLAEIRQGSTGGNEPAFGGGGGETEEEGGTGLAMGQVTGKFIVTPDWDAMFG
ncbi:MAG: hypothetical protein M1827_001524 [Pycnora praestabilis]|nr:MAG: hypothetical protein M1827_001524 [Pycnora praestabilis]